MDLENCAVSEPLSELRKHWVVPIYSTLSPLANISVIAELFWSILQLEFFLIDNSQRLFLYLQACCFESSVFFQNALEAVIPHWRVCETRSPRRPYPVTRFSPDFLFPVEQCPLQAMQCPTARWENRTARWEFAVLEVERRLSLCLSLYCLVFQNSRSTGFFSLPGTL